MLFKRGNYLLDKQTNLVHDLLAIESDKIYKTKLVPECTELIPTIEDKDRKYYTFNRFIALYAKGKLNGCPKCLPGFNKERNAKAKKHSKK
jgi:hypothetical protein